MDFLNMLAANSAFNQQLFFTDQSKCMVSGEANKEASGSSVERGQKRRRLRRHPVWEYFGDIADKVVGCKLCNFNTVSAFSTNLKMHLKSHHKLEFIKVMEKELDQLAKETPEDQCESLRTSPTTLSDLDTSAPRMKRRRKTVQELRDTINRCKQSIERDRTHGAKSHHLSLNSNPIPLKMENIFAQGNGFAAIESIIQQQQSHLSPTLPIKSLFETKDVQNEPLPVENNDNEGQEAKLDTHTVISMLKLLEQENPTDKFVASFRKNLREVALNELVCQSGSAPFIFSPAFQDFVYTLDPTFNISENLFNQASSNPKPSI